MNTNQTDKLSNSDKYMEADDAAQAERQRHKNQPRLGSGNQFGDVNPASYTKKGSY